MIFIHLLSLILISAFVQAQNLPLGVAVNIMDFQGNVFDLANTSPLDLAPVGTLNHKVGISAQEWRITGAAPKFTVINLGATSFLSFTTAVSGVNPIVTQICGHPNQQTLWNITPSADGLGFNIIEPVSQLAITSWPRYTNATSPDSLGPWSPLTLQPLDSTRHQQVFTFPLWN